MGMRFFYFCAGLGLGGVSVCVSWLQITAVLTHHSVAAFTCRTPAEKDNAESSEHLESAFILVQTDPPPVIQLLA